MLQVTPCCNNVTNLQASTANMFPTGYQPENPREQVIVVTFAIMGAVLYACIVGSISSIAMGYDASGRMFKQKVDELKEYMSWRQLDATTQRKVLKYFHLKYREKYFDELALLNEMNESLKNEIAAHNCKELISKVPFLRREQQDGRDDLFIGRISSALEPCYYIAGDVLFVQGEVGRDMYFCLSGTLHVIIGGKRVAVLGDGSFFGVIEIALIANIPRTATVQAAGSCMLYRLTQKAFNAIASTFEDVKRKVDEIYTERMNKFRMDEDARKVVIAREMISQVPVLQRKERDGRDDIWLKKIAELMVPVFFAGGDVIFKEGDNADGM
ncbi:hypothetical protein HK100_008397, partial [Physocladia obscura]